MGPGVATFLCVSIVLDPVHVPGTIAKQQQGAESFPTPIRGHFLGLAAAVGKAGAAIGTQVFTPIQNSFDSEFAGVQGVFLIGAAFAAVGGLIAWFLIPDRERDLEGEDARFRAYLAEHGYDTEFGESLQKNLKSTAFKV
jgi:MFS family permease